MQPISSENRALITASHYLLRIFVARTHRRCGIAVRLFDDDCGCAKRSCLNHVGVNLIRLESLQLSKIFDSR